MSIVETNSRAVRRGAPVPESDRSALARAVELHGERAVASGVGVSVHGLARALAGLNVHGCTATAVRAYVRDQAAQ